MTRSARWVLGVPAAHDTIPAAIAAGALVIRRDGAA